MKMQNKHELRIYILIIKINEWVALDLCFHQVLETLSLEELKKDVQTLVFGLCVQTSNSVSYTLDRNMEIG